MSILSTQPRTTGPSSRVQQNEELILGTVVSHTRMVASAVGNLEGASVVGNLEGTSVAGNPAVASADDNPAEASAVEMEDSQTWTSVN
eukprot:CAMPEP_0194503054 /NCGR_PEP_ID=MMETSP0253-20130528/28168_1 /TAXON_ID=2966 /ORGANISM="Noctiluca scintillans" /LENGTH=87 /DNA_ID=CAMNT_0039345301 /DNA_START=225 /DNA_END=488 /DNA_ORIENTATION=+